MNSIVTTYQAKDRCPTCGMALNSMARNEREDFKTAAATDRKSLVDILLLPVGAISGLLIFTFPLSLPVIYVIALFFVK